MRPLCKLNLTLRRNESAKIQIINGLTNQGMCLLETRLKTKMILTFQQVAQFTTLLSIGLTLHITVNTVESSESVLACDQRGRAVATVYVVMFVVVINFAETHHPRKKKKLCKMLAFIYKMRSLKVEVIGG